MQKLTLIRGLPGSGKSTLAKTLDIPHYEADMFFMKESIVLMHLSCTKHTSGV